MATVQPERPGPGARNRPRRRLTFDRMDVVARRRPHPRHVNSCGLSCQEAGCSPLKYLLAISGSSSIEFNEGENADGRADQMDPCCGSSCVAFPKRQMSCANSECPGKRSEAACDLAGICPAGGRSAD